MRLSHGREVPAQKPVEFDRLYSNLKSAAGNLLQPVALPQALDEAGTTAEVVAAGLLE